MQSNHRQSLVVGNWKSNGDSNLARTFNEAMQSWPQMNTESVVCPPFPYLAEFQHSPVKSGAQNLSQYGPGAFTGEISAEMLKDLGCSYVIVGHSERRAMGESNQDVAEKVFTALQTELTPICCCGEPDEVRSDGNYLGFIESQLEPVVERIGIDSFTNVVLAYEPIWAIGTGNTASPEQAQEVHQYIREFLSKHNAQIASQVQILYGGSVKGANAKELFSQADIDGGLIGGASLKVDEFLDICLAADQ